MRNSADAMQVDRYRRMSPSEKLSLAAELRQMDLDLLAVGIQTSRGKLPPDRLRLEVLRLTLPERLFRAAYDPP